MTIKINENLVGTTITILIFCFIAYLGSVIGYSKMEYEYKKNCATQSVAHPFSSPKCRIAFEQHIKGFNQKELR